MAHDDGRGKWETELTKEQLWDRMKLPTDFVRTCGNCKFVNIDDETQFTHTGMLQRKNRRGHYVPVNMDQSMCSKFKNPALGCIQSNRPHWKHNDI